MALNVISISAEGLAAYVVAESRAGRLVPATDCRRLTECEAFLLRWREKRWIRGLALVNAFRVCDNK
jgi:hypothetical protein